MGKEGEETTKVLLVDDEPSMLEISEIFLENHGDLEVETTSSASSALDLLAGDEYDAIISDYQMPEMDGIEFLRTVRSNGIDLPFILFTGKGREEVVIEALNNGADFYIKKGGEPKAQFAELANTVKQAVGRKKAEETLGKSEERYRTTLDNMLEGCQIIGSDWRYLYLNEAAAMHGHRQKEELLGKTMMESYSGIEETDMFAALRECMESRARRRLENEFTYPDGSRGWFELSVEPVPEGIFILSIDITERKKAEAMLRESEEKYRSLYSSMGEGVALHRLVCDANGNPVDYLVQDVNPAFETITGIGKETAVGRKASTLYGTPSPPYLDVYARVALTGEPISFETFFPPMGKHFSISAFSPSKGKFATVFADITERKRREEALATLTRKLQLLGSLTRHDLLNHLTVIRGYQGLLEGMTQDEKQLDYLNKIKTTSMRIEKLLAFGKDFEETGVKEPGWANLAEAIRRSIPSTLRVKVVFAPTVSAVDILADRLIERVFYNLLDNSIVHGEKVTEARIGVEKTEEGIKIVFEDDGVGIPVSKKEAVFKYGSGKGGGYGLYFSREILSILGMTIKERGEEGKGARFEIFVPREKYRTA